MTNQLDLNISFDLLTIQSATQKLLSYFEEDRIFLFQGTLGAGKTTFVKSICKELGVIDETSSQPFQS